MSAAAATMTRLVSQEEGRLLRKSQRLWDQLVQTEERAREIMLETERLKRAKDEAKELVARKHPHLFRDASSADYEDEDDFALRSFSSAGHSRDSYLNQELREIKDMLGRHGRTGDGRGGHGSDGGVGARIERLRREVSGASNPAAAVNAAPATAVSAWPEDCVPVPVETFKRLLADAAAAAVKSRRRGGRDHMGHDGRHRRESVNGRGSSGEDSRLGVDGGDDTSHDVADLSSQEAEEDAAPRKIEIGHPDDDRPPRDRKARARQQPAAMTPAPRYARRKLDGAEKAIVPPKVPSKRETHPPQPSDQAADGQRAVSAAEEDISSRRSASGAENSAQVDLPLSNALLPEVRARKEDEEVEEHFANNARHYEDVARRASKGETSGTTPDENFVLNSEDGNQKLYSSATSEEEAAAGNKMRGSSPSKPQIERARMDENERPKKTALRLGQSDTEASSGGDMRQKLYDEVVSGPETTGDDDDGDFWG